MGEYKRSRVNLQGKNTAPMSMLTAISCQISDNNHTKPHSTLLETWIVQ